jgi:endogenous inhibitor of DNA gyrase (YacG/DUF329 family)
MKPRKICCARCGAVTEYSLENKWRPFCSQRCRMIDLGKWAAEDYRVAEEPREEPREDDSPSSKRRGS